jgi:hypothetical protein
VISGRLAAQPVLRGEPKACHHSAGKDFPMSAFDRLKSFASSECGAVTVDWVVLTAAVVGLGLVVMNTVSDGLADAATAIVSDLDAARIRASEIE